MGLPKDSGYGDRVPTLSAMASGRPQSGKRAKEGQELASQMWLAKKNKNHELEESPAQFTKKQKQDNPVTYQAVRLNLPYGVDM